MRKVKLSLDQLEEDRAVLLAKGFEEEIIFPRFLLPSRAVEGDMLNFFIEVSKKDTEKAKANIQRLLGELKKD